MPDSAAAADQYGRAVRHRVASAVVAVMLDDQDRMVRDAYVSRPKKNAAATVMTGCGVDGLLSLSRGRKVRRGPGLTPLEPTLCVREARG